MTPKTKNTQSMTPLMVLAICCLTVSALPSNEYKQGFEGQQNQHLEAAENTNDGPSDLEIRYLMRVMSDINSPRIYNAAPEYDDENEEVDDENTMTLNDKRRFHALRGKRKFHALRGKRKFHALRGKRKFHALRGKRKFHALRGKRKFHALRGKRKFHALRGKRKFHALRGKRKFYPLRG